MTTRRCSKSKLEITPEPSQLTRAQDIFGNHVATARFADRASELRFESTIRVDHVPTGFRSVDIQDFARTHPFAYGAKDRSGLARWGELRGEAPAAAAMGAVATTERTCEHGAMHGPQHALSAVIAAKAARAIARLLRFKSTLKTITCLDFHHQCIRQPAGRDDDGRGPDEANLMQDAYDVLKQYPPGVIPPAVLIELSPLSSQVKQRMQALMQQPVDPMAMQANQLELRGACSQDQRTRCARTTPPLAERQRRGERCTQDVGGRPQRAERLHARPLEGAGPLGLARGAATEPGTELRRSSRDYARGMRFM